jgi:hypothetical protein
VSELEVFNKTHRRKGGTGEFVSERAKRTVVGPQCLGYLHHLEVIGRQHAKCLESLLTVAELCFVSTSFFRRASRNVWRRLAIRT